MRKEETQGFSLKSFTCAVIGVGGLGCNIAVHLAGAGAGQLILVDFDTVSKTNLNRQFLYTKDDIGEKKAESAKKRLEAFSPDINITALPVKIKKDFIPEELKSADMIFLAADNKSARENTALFCEENKIPLMTGGIDGFYGKAYLYIPGATPTLKKAGMLDGKKPQTNISAAAGIIGSLQAATGIQYLLTKDISLGGKLTVFDKDEFHTLTLK